MDRVKYDIFCIGACVQDILLEGIEEEDFKNSVTVLKRAVFTSGSACQDRYRHGGKCGISGSSE